MAFGDSRGGPQCSQLRRAIAVAVLLLAACVPEEVAADVVVRLPDRDCRATDTECAFNLGSVEVADVSARAFDVVNLGNAPASIVNVEVLGDPSFTLEQAPAELEPGQSDPLVIAFQPRGPTTITTTLFVTWADPQATIEVHLQAQGAFGNLTIDPLSCEFGDVPVGTTSPPCIVTFSNPGAVDLNVDDLTVVPPFGIPGVLIIPVIVPPGAASAISIVATPTSTGVTSGFASFRVGTAVTAVSLQVNGV